MPKQIERRMRRDADGDRWRVAVFLAAALLLTAPVLADVQVRVRGRLVDVSATAAPLSQILDWIALAVGTEIEYGGVRPSQRLTLAFSNRSPAEALLGVLDGQGLNFAIQLDATGHGVQKLLIAAATPRSARRPPPTPARRATPPRPLQRPTPPPLLQFDSEPDPEDEEDLEDSEGEDGTAVVPATPLSTPRLPARLPGGPVIFPRPIAADPGTAPTPEPQN